MSGQIRPSEDQVQNAVNVSGNVENGWTTVTFSRALDTGDASDFNFDGQACAFFLYAWGGDVTNGQPTRHTNREFSSVQYCFTNCDVQASSTTTTTTTPLPPGNVVLLRFVGFSFKLLDQWDEAYADTSSFEYFRLKNRVFSLVRKCILCNFSTSTCIPENCG